MPASYSDVLLIGGVPNQWIKLVSNGIAQAAGTAYVSDAVTTFPSSTQGGGVFSFATGPLADIYTVWTLSGSLSSTKPASGDTRWVATGNTNYVVAYTAGDAAALKSGSFSSAPYTTDFLAGAPGVTGLIYDKGGSIYNLLAPAYGIKGDGSTDDSGAISTLVAAVAAAGGGTIVAPRPSVYYKLLNPITWASNVNLIGAGAVSQFHDALGNMIQINLTNCSNFSIQSIGFTGLTQVGFATIGGRAPLYLVNCTHFYIGDIYVNGVSTTGIAFTNSSFGRIGMLDITQTIEHGIYVGTGNSDLTFAPFMLSQISQYGNAGLSGTASASDATSMTDSTQNWPVDALVGRLLTMGGSTLSVTTNTATKATGTAWSPPGPVTGAYTIAPVNGSAVKCRSPRITFAGGAINTTTGPAILWEAGADNCSMGPATITGSGLYAIRVNAVTGTKQIAPDISAVGGGNAAVRLFGAATGFQLIGGHIDHPGAVGVQTDTTSVDTQIMGVEFTGGTTIGAPAVDDFGIDTIISSGNIDSGHSHGIKTRGTNARIYMPRNQAATQVLDVSSTGTVRLDEVTLATYNYVDAATGAIVSTRPASAISETWPRGAAANVVNAGIAITPGTLYLTGIALRAGQVISNILFRTGTTGLTTAGTPHWWFSLHDSSRNQVAITADQTTANILASTLQSLAIATIASGASGTYTVPTTGLYYLGFMFASGGGTQPTMLAATMSSGITAIPPILCGTSDTTQTTPPGFPHQATGIAALSNMLYGYVT